MYHLYVKTFIPRKEAIFMNRNFKGIYASLIREFVSLKRSMGFKYIGGEFVLTLFDRFTIERNETAIGITKEYRRQRQMCIRDRHGARNVTMNPIVTIIVGAIF